MELAEVTPCHLGVKILALINAILALTSQCYMA